MSQVCYVSSELLEIDFIDYYYGVNTKAMLEYVALNKKKLQKGKYANTGCTNLIIPSSLRGKFSVTHRDIDIPVVFIVDIE